VPRLVYTVNRIAAARLAGRSRARSRWWRSLRTAGWVEPEIQVPKPAPPETQRVSSPGNQRMSLLGKQRVSEESQTTATDLQTNEDHISKWKEARESELTSILMSKSILYSYQDTSYANPDRTKGHTADWETSRTSLNCMISENVKWTTIDLTDFYIGTLLPHPEYIRIPISMTQISPRCKLKRGTTNLASLALTAQCLISLCRSDVPAQKTSNTNSTTPNKNEKI
jgi:hypothetical protein